MRKQYTYRKGFVGVRPDGSVILQSCSYYANQTRRWVCECLSPGGRDVVEPWRYFRDKGYRVVKCEIIIEVK